MAHFYSRKKPQMLAELKKQLDELTLSSEQKLAEQKERIFQLVDENKKLSDELSSYRKKDADISQVLMHALAKAKEIETSAKQKYTMEIERLKLFHAKWVQYYTKIRASLPVNEQVLSAEAFLAEMDKMLGFKSPVFSSAEKEAAKQFLSESKRLSTDNYSKQSETSSELTLENDIDLEGFIAASASLECTNQDYFADSFNNQAKKVAENNNLLNNYKVKDFTKFTSVKNKQALTDSGIDLNEILNPKNLPSLDAIISDMEFLKK